MTVLIRISGLAELRRALNDVAKDTPKALAKANKQIGQIVVSEARSRAPKGPHEGSGHVGPLTASIKASLSASRVRITAGGSKAPYAAAIEFGGYIPRRKFHGLNRRGKAAALAGGRTGILTHVLARPYVRPAIQAKLADVLIAYERMLNELGDRLRRI